MGKYYSVKRSSSDETIDMTEIEDNETLQHTFSVVTMNYIGSGDWLDENKNYGKYDVDYGFIDGIHSYSLELRPNKNRKMGLVYFQNSKKERITPGFISDAVRKQAKSECNLTDSECNLIGRQVSKKIRSYTGQHEGYYSPNLNDAKPFRDRFKQMSHSFTVVSAYDEEYLEHHGILGMKWGIRRFQNPDGTLTAEGRERYGIKTKSTGGNSEYSTGIDKLKSKYEKNLTDATIQRRSAIHYQNKPNGEKASKFTRASMAGALDKADRYEKKAEKIKNKAEKKYGAKFEINDRDYKEVYDEVMKYYERKTTSEIGKERAAWVGKNLILGGALGGALWSTLDLVEGKNIHSKYKIKE